MPLPALTVLLLLARPDAVVLENSVTIELVRYTQKQHASSWCP